MKIILIRDLFGKSRGDILEVEPCPIDNIEYYFDLWVKGEKEVFRLLDNEFLVAEEDNASTTINKFIRKQYCLFGKEKAIKEFLKLDPTITMDSHGEIFEKIIAGDAEFIESDNQNIEICYKEDTLYKEYLNHKFNKYFVFEGSVYKPVSFVIDLGDEDEDFNIDFSIDNCLFGKRASFYCTKRTDVVFEGIIDEVKAHIICQKVNMDKDNIKNTYKEVVYKNLAETGYSIYCENNEIDINYNSSRYINNFKIAAEEKERKEYLEYVKKEVLKKSPTFEVMINNIKYNIPIYPFKIWRHSLTTHDKIIEEEILYGEAICYSGLKLRNDNPFHNDWIIGAGINPDIYYDLSNTKEWRNFLYGTDNKFYFLNKKEDENEVIFFKKEKEPELIDIINASDTGDIVVSTNLSKTAHLVNNCSELNVSLICCLFDLEKNDIFLGKKGTAYNFSSSGIPLNQAKFGKAGLLAILKNKGYPVLDGVFFDEIPSYIYSEEQLIFRSSGIEESDNITASGLFKSLIGNSLNTFKEVWDSFSSDLAKKYLSKLNVSVSPGVLVQPYIEADESSVIKFEGNLHISYFKGACSNIVDGNLGVLNGEREETIQFLSIFKKIQVEIQEKIEVEFLKKDGKIFILQVTKLK